MRRVAEGHVEKGAVFDGVDDDDGGAFDPGKHGQVAADERGHGGVVLEDGSGKHEADGVLIGGALWEVRGAVDDGGADRGVEAVCADDEVCRDCRSAVEREARVVDIH